jgi:hypothetical protein
MHSVKHRPAPVRIITNLIDIVGATIPLLNLDHGSFLKYSMLAYITGWTLVDFFYLTGRVLKNKPLIARLERKYFR